MRRKVSYIFIDIFLRKYSALVYLVKTTSRLNDALRFAMIIMIKIRDSQWKIMLCNNPSKGHFKVHLNERGRVGGEGGVHKVISNHFEVFFFTG